MAITRPDHGRDFGDQYSNFGSDTYGHDVKMFGATTGKYAWWDASADTFYVVGTLSLDGTFAADNIALVDSETLSFGTGTDVTMQWDGTNFIFSTAADDKIFEIGDSAATQLSFDIKWYGDGANGSDYLYFDASENLVYTTDVDFQFKDNDVLAFGTGASKAGDISITYDGSNLIIATAADDDLVEIGDSAATQKSLDLKWYANESNGASYAYFDASENLIYTTGVDLQFKDDDYLVFGTGSGATGDINIRWTSGALAIAGTAASSGATVGAESYIIDFTHWGDYSFYNYEAAATGPVITGAKGRASGAACSDNDICLQLTGKGYNDNASPALETIANIKMLITDSTDTEEDGAIVFETMTAGAAATEKFRVGETAITASEPLTVGVNDTGYDVTLYGATSGCSFLWDESEDQLVLTGPADVPVLKIAGQGSYCNMTTYSADGAAWADAGTPAFIADQRYIMIDLAGTVYRIPIWANS